MAIVDWKTPLWIDSPAIVGASVLSTIGYVTVSKGHRLGARPRRSAGEFSAHANWCGVRLGVVQRAAGYLDMGRGGCHLLCDELRGTARGSQQRGRLMITLHAWPTPNAHKVSIMLEECGLEYEVVEAVDITAGDQFKPAVPGPQPE